MPIQQHYEHTAARELTAREPTGGLMAREPLGEDGPCASRPGGLTARAPLGYGWPVRRSGIDGPCAAGELTAREPPLELTVTASELLGELTSAMR
jgi:hypothetical protein